MGNAAIWWRPYRSSVVRKIDLGVALSDLQVLPTDRQETIEETLGGRIVSTRLRSRQRIRVVTQPWLSYSLWTEVEAMVERLRQGGRVTLAEDDAISWAAYVSDWTDPGTVVVDASPWAAYGGTPSIGQHWRAMGPSPRLLQEGGTIANGAFNFNSTAFRAGGVIVPTNDAVHDWTGEEWVLIRQLGFWPCLRMPAESRDQGAILHKSRRSFKLEITLEVDVDGLAAIAATPAQLLNGTTDEGYPTMDELIAASR